MNTEGVNIFVQIPSYIFWKDLNSTFLGCNSNFASIAGLMSPDDIIGRTDFDLVWGKTHAELYRQGDKEVLDGISKINVRESQLKCNGKLTTILINKIPLVDNDNQIIGVIGSYMELVYTNYTGKFDPSKLNTELSPRQAECLYYLVLGKHAKQIAEEMNISARTAEYHITILKQKLKCRSKSELIAKGLSLDFIKFKVLEV